MNHGMKPCVKYGTKTRKKGEMGNGREINNTWRLWKMKENDWGTNENGGSWHTKLPFIIALQGLGKF